MGAGAIRCLLLAQSRHAQCADARGSEGTFPGAAAAWRSRDDRSLSSGRRYGGAIEMRG